MTTRSSCLPILLFAFLGASCHHDHPHEGEGHSHGDGHVHSHGHSPGHSHDHGDSHGDELAVTRWGETTLLFVEFPVLVVGEESPFLAHLTRRSDHHAIDSGRVVVELSGGEVPVERFKVEGPAMQGIFRPIVRPMHPGPRQVTLTLMSNAANETHTMGEIHVFSSREEANAAVKDEEVEEGEISFSLEQQWRVPFRVEKVSAQRMRPSVPAFAHLAQAPDSEAVVSAPRSGRVVPVGGRMPRAGESMKEGALLFRITTAPQDGDDSATLDLAVEQAEIRVSAARREVERLASLVDEGVVPQRRMDASRSDLAAAEAELRSAQRRRGSFSQAQRLGANREALGVPAPISGVIADLLVSPGTWVSEGDQLVRIVDRSRLHLSVGVPEAYISRLRDISGAWFQLDHVSGVIDVPATALVTMGTEVDPKTRTLPVRFELENVRGELFAGMRTRAHLIVDQPLLTTSVPMSAIVDDGGQNVVYVQMDGESFQRRPVQLGIRDGDYVEVTSGLALGEWVVVMGAYSVRLAAVSTDTIGHGHTH